MNAPVDAYHSYYDNSKQKHVFQKEEFDGPSGYNKMCYSLVIDIPIRNK